jgi:O-antigen ligase
VIVVREARRSTARSMVSFDIAADLAGPALLLALAGWTLVAAGRWEPPVRSAIELYAAVAAVILVGELLGRVVAAPIVPWVVVLASIPVAWMSVTDGWADGRMNEPFGYPNAQAAFFVLGVVAALMAAVTSSSRVLRVLAFIAAAGFALIVLASGSLAASLLLLLPAAAVAMRTLLSARRFTIVMALLVLFVFAGTVILAAGFARGTDERSTFASALTGRRLALWHDALVMVRDQPLVGVGPGRFRSESPTARSDQDAQWAHNDFLQQGAETGLMGLGLLLGVFLWGFWRLGTGPRGSTAAALASAGLAALGIHASVDYVLRFPALPLVAAALVGWAITASRTREPRAGTA